MEIRQMATAFIFNENKVLMMKKNRSSFVQFPFWSGLGGHIEADERNEPKRACVREIFEESGIEEHELEELKLKYILLRVKEEEIRQQFVYFGRTSRNHVISSDEGELHWVEKEHILQLPLSKIIHFTIEHYFMNPARSEITIGTISRDGEDNPYMQWSELKDPIVF